jgi:hypothetical protein
MIIILIFTLIKLYVKTNPIVKLILLEWFNPLIESSKSVQWNILSIVKLYVSMR